MYGFLHFSIFDSMCTVFLQLLRIRYISFFVLIRLFLEIYIFVC